MQIFYFYCNVAILVQKALSSEELDDFDASIPLYRRQIRMMGKILTWFKIDKKCMFAQNKQFFATQ